MIAPTVTVIDQIIYFGADQSGNSCLVSGWGTPEDGFVWSEGKYAKLEIESVSTVSTIQMTVWGYTPPEAGPQEMLVFVNGSFAGYYEIAARTICDLALRRPVPPPVQIDFVISTAKRPSDHEGGTDKRQLGIALADLKLSR